jgi:hypothetical protein
MFGTDTTPKADAYRIYYRFLETDDEYFDCRESHHLQGFWRIYGINLPREVLEKVYNKNAMRILRLEGAAPLPKVMHVKPVEDFELTGDGSNEAWKKAEWQSLERRADKGLPYDAKIKLLYSKTGLYVLFTGSDKKLTASLTGEGKHLWTEDVFEVFLQTDDEHPDYFEYEISPLGSELVLQVTNKNGQLLRWQPWVFDEGNVRTVHKATSVTGGEKKSGSSISNWTAEVFIPYDALKPLSNTIPKPGSRWRANFYRVDHDDGQTTGWDWSRVGKSFHDYRKFGTLLFD